MAEDRSTNQTLLEKMHSEVAPETSPLLRFLTNNAKRITIVMAVCFVAAAGYGIYSWQAGKKIAAAQEALARILILQDGADRLAKLKAFAPGVPETMTKAVTLAVAQTAMQTKEYADAFQAWDSLAKDTKDSLYIPAMVGKAEALSLQGKGAEAMAILESIALPADSEANNLVNAAIVDLAEQAGNLEKAIAVCEKLILGMAARSPEEAEFWRQKAASLRAAKS